MKIKNFIYRNKWWIGAAIVVLIFILTSLRAGKNSDVETVEIQPVRFIRNVSVAGKVVPAEEVELGFDRGGRVAVVYKAVGEKVYAGETIAVISSGDTTADIAKAEADLQAEKARLSELQNGGSTSFGTELDIKNRELKEALAEAYTTADDVIMNNVDQVFNDKNKIAFAFDDYELKQEIDQSRREIGYMLKNWSEDRLDIDLAEKNLVSVKEFLERIALAVNNFKAEGSTYTQTEINKFKSDISIARTNINSSISNITSAKDNIRGSEAEIPYQEAKVKSAEASVARLQADSQKNVITAPFSGVVTVQDAKVGQIVGVNQVVTKIISDNAFQIETFVPEINIGEVMIGNMANVTLDAYGTEEVFVAKAITIDPAETIRDGVSTYKTKFQFVEDDTRLRSGMTANVEITTLEKDDSLVIGADSIIDRDGFKYVQVLVGEEIIEKQITIGDADSTGSVEIISGLKVGEKVVKKPIVSE